MRHYFKPLKGTKLAQKSPSRVQDQKEKVTAWEETEQYLTQWWVVNWFSRQISDFFTPLPPIFHCWLTPWPLLTLLCASWPVSGLAKQCERPTESRHRPGLTWRPEWLTSDSRCSTFWCSRQSLLQGIYLNSQGRGRGPNEEAKFWGWPSWLRWALAYFSNFRKPNMFFSLLASVQNIF